MTEVRWTLSEFADFHTAHFDDQIMPANAGDRCKRFTGLIRIRHKLTEADAQQYAERLLVSGLIGLHTLFDRSTSMRSSLPFAGATLTWPIIVAHEPLFQRRYSVVYEHSSLNWDSEEPPVRTVLDEIRFLHSLSAIRYFRDALPALRLFDDKDGAVDRAYLDAIEELGYAWRTIPSIIMPRLPRLPTVSVPTPAQTVTTGDAFLGGAFASIGVCGHSDGLAVATTAAHAIGQNRTVIIAGHECPVVQTDYIRDAAKIDISHLPWIPGHTVRPLRSLVPLTGQIHYFEGAASGAAEHTLAAWDAGLPWLAHHLPVQAHVYSESTSQPGDSGAALRDAQQRVVGFAHYRVPQDNPERPPIRRHPGLSAWVWAESVFDTLQLS